MAFIKNNLIQDRASNRSPVFNVFSYSNLNDSIDDITAAGYFDDNGFELRNNSVIKAMLSDGYHHLVYDKDTQTATESGGGSSLTTEQTEAVEGVYFAKLLRKLNADSSMLEEDSSIATITVDDKDLTLTKEYLYKDYPEKFNHSAAIEEQLYDNAIRLASTAVKSGVGTVAGGYDQVHPSWEFYTDAIKFNLMTRYNTGFTISVDGVMVSKDLSVAASQGGNKSYQTIEFSEKKMRKIRVNMRKDSGSFYGVGVLPTDTVYCDPLGISMAIFGDSFSTGTSDNIAGLTYTSAMAQMLGIIDYQISGQGGTSFVSDAGGDKYNYEDRMSDISYREWDIIYVSMTVNDSDHYETDLPISITSWYNAIRARYPDTLIVVGGTPGVGRIPQRISQEEVAISTFESFNDERVITLKALTLDDPIFMGTGWVGAETGEGNSDIYCGDATHFVKGGHEIFARQQADMLINALIDKT